VLPNSNVIDHFCDLPDPECMEIFSCCHCNDCKGD
jgi:hypothetical protein